MTKILKRIGDAIYSFASAIAFFLAFFACPGAILAYLTGYSRLHRLGDAIIVSAVFLGLSLVTWGVGRTFLYVLARA